MTDTNSRREQASLIKQDWGYCYMFDSELDALRFAYKERNALYGIQFRAYPDIKQYSVTIFNEAAVRMGIDRS